METRKSIFKAEILEQFANKKLKVAVHNGMFHADDVFSVALIRRLAKECKAKLEIVRTRDPFIFAQADMRIDVGNLWDEESLSFDHHQDDIHLMQPEGVKHAAIGLICKWCMEPQFLTVFRLRYVLGLEYQDNTGKPHSKYPSIGFAIQPFLPAYGEEVDIDKQFDMALQIAEVILERAIKTVDGILKSEAEFKKSVVETLADGKIVVLDKKLPIEPEFHPELAFTIFPVPSGYSFRGMNGHVAKKDLCGLNGAILSNTVGYEGVFVHKDGFTGVMCTLDGAKQICLMSL